MIKSPLPTNTCKIRNGNIKNVFKHSPGMCLKTGIRYEIDIITFER